MCLSLKMQLFKAYHAAGGDSDYFSLVDRGLPLATLAAVDATEFRGSRICHVRFRRLELLLYDLT